MTNEIIAFYKNILIFDSEFEGLIKKNVWVIKCDNNHKFLIKSNTIFPDDYIKGFKCPICLDSNKS